MYPLPTTGGVEPFFVLFQQYYTEHLKIDNEKHALKAGRIFIVVKIRNTRRVVIFEIMLKAP